MFSISRRMLMLSAPAALLPANGRTTPVEVDAELISLGNEFEKCHAAWLAIRPAYEASSRKFEQWIRTRKTAGPSEAWSASLYARAFEETGHGEVGKLNEAHCEVLHDLQERILAMPAHSDLGIAAKQKTLSFALGLSHHLNHHSKKA